MSDWPASVLFVCQMNSVRSPMAAALLRRMSGGKSYTESCGIKPGFKDEFMVAVMGEIGIDMGAHEAQTLAQLQDANFDYVICFTQSAYAAAQAVFEDDAAEVKYWPMPDPGAGSLDVRAIMDQYRNLRMAMEQRLRREFAPKDPA